MAAYFLDALAASFLALPAFLTALATYFLATLTDFLRALTSFLRAATLAFNFFYSDLPLTSLSFILEDIRSPFFLVSFALSFCNLA